MANQDPHAKRLLTTYPKETLEVFAPHILAQHGDPTSIESVNTEVFNLDPQGRSGMLDVALKYTFAGGSEYILLMIEHWSAAKDVDHRRTGRYLFELLWCHPKAYVLPIMLITDPSVREASSVPHLFSYAIADQEVVTITFTVHVINHEWRQRMATMRNVVAISLWVVPNDGQPIERVLAALRYLVDLKPDWDRSALELLLVCLTEMARLKKTEKAQLYQRVKGDPAMSATLVDLIKADGKAEGKAEGEIQALLSMVKKGFITPDIARTQLAEWRDQGDIPQAMYQDVIKQLGD